MNKERFHAFTSEHTSGDKKSEKTQIKRKLAYSLGLTLVSTVVYKGAEISILAGLVSEPYLQGAVENFPYLVFGGALAADYFTSLVSGAQNLRLLENRRIGTSPNLVATSAYYASEKIIPQHKTVRNLLTAVVPSFISEDPFFIALALVNEQMLIRVAAAKLLTTGLNLTQIAGKEAVLRTVGREKKVDRDKGISRRGIVFALAKIVKR